MNIYNPKVFTRPKLPLLSKWRTHNSWPNNPILLFYERNRALMDIYNLCAFHKDWKTDEGPWVFTRSKQQFFLIQGHISLDPMIQLCLFLKGTELWLILAGSVSLVKVGWEMKALRCSQGQKCHFQGHVNLTQWCDFEKRRLYGVHKTKVNYGRTTDNTPSRKLLRPMASRAKYW